MFRRMQQFSFFVFMLVFFLLCGTNISVYADAKEEFHETYTLKSGTPVSVQNTNGDIKITAWDKDYVDVLAVKQTKKSSTELDKVEIRISQNGKLSIETEYLKKNARVSVNYTIKVPENIPLDNIKTTNGSIELTGTTGDTRAGTTNGKIRIRDVGGTVNARTTNGDITITGTSGITNVKTTNGSIDVSFSEFENDVDIVTTNGSINVRFPGDINADIELKTTNGRIKANQVQILVDEISKKYVKGKLGSGGNRLYVKTTNGSITLEKM